MRKRFLPFLVFLIVMLMLNLQINPVFSTEIFNDGFESEDDTFTTNWTGKYEDGATMSVVTSPVYSGAKAASASGLGTVGDRCHARKAVTGYSDLYVRIYYRLETLPTATGSYWRTGPMFATSTETTIIAFTHYSFDNSKWGIRYYATTGWTSIWETGTSTVAADTWYSIEMHIVSADSGTLELWIDGTQKVSSTGIDTNTRSPIANIEVGNPYVSVAEASDRTVYIDNVIVADTYIGTEFFAQLYLNNYTEVTRQWTEVGSTPWLDAQDQPTNYIYVSAKNKIHEEFNFPNLPVGASSISMVELFAYLDCGTEKIQVDVWDGSAWNAIEFTGNGWAWHSSDISNILDTVAKVNGAKIKLVSKNIGGWSGSVSADVVYLNVGYTEEGAEENFYGTINQTFSLTHEKTVSFNRYGILSQQFTINSEITYPYYGLKFDGSDDLVEAPDDPSLRLTDKGTITFWFQSGGSQSDNIGFVGKLVNMFIPGMSYSIHRGTTEDIELELSNGSSNNVINTAFDYTNTDWHFVASRWNGTHLQLSLDLAEETPVSQTVDAQSNSGHPLRIGRFNAYFLGIIDEICIYNRSITTEEISYSYNNGVGNHNPLNQTGLVGWWHLNEGTGDTAYDETANDNDGTLEPNYPSNAPLWVMGHVPLTTTAGLIGLIGLVFSIVGTAIFLQILNLFGTIAQAFTIGFAKSFSFNILSLITQVFTIESTAEFIGGEIVNFYGVITQTFTVEHLTTFAFSIFGSITQTFIVTSAKTILFSLSGIINLTFIIESTAEFISGQIINLFGSVSLLFTIGSLKIISFTFQSIINPIFTVIGQSIIGVFQSFYGIINLQFTVDTFKIITLSLQSLINPSFSIKSITEFITNILNFYGIINLIFTINSIASITGVVAVITGIEIAIISLVIAVCGMAFAIAKRR